MPVHILTTMGGGRVASGDGGIIIVVEKGENRVRREWIKREDMKLTHETHVGPMSSNSRYATQLLQIRTLC